MYKFSFKMSCSTMLLVLLALLLTTGCSSVKTLNIYSGPELSSNKVATLKSECGVDVLEINNQKIDIWKECWGKGYLLGETVFKLPPGRHSILVSESSSSGYANPTQLNLSAIVGHTYLIRYVKIRGKECWDPVSYNMSIADVTNLQN